MRLAPLISSAQKPAENVNFIGLTSVFLTYLRKVFRAGSGQKGFFKNMGGSLSCSATLTVTVINQSIAAHNEAHMDDIGVRDVAQSFKWYQSLFGQPATAPGHDNWVRSSIRTEPSCYVCTNGARTSILP